MASDNSNLTKLRRSSRTSVLRKAGKPVKDESKSEPEPAKKSKPRLKLRNRPPTRHLPRLPQKTPRSASSLPQARGPRTTPVDLQIPTTQPKTHHPPRSPETPPSQQANPHQKAPQPSTHPPPPYLNPPPPRPQQARPPSPCNPHPPTPPLSTRTRTPPSQLPCAPLWSRVWISWVRCWSLCGRVLRFGRVVRGRNMWSCRRRG